MKITITSIFTPNTVGLILFLIIDYAYEKSVMSSNDGQFTFAVGKRIKRSGGYPKFPYNPLTNNVNRFNDAIYRYNTDVCGTRSVRFYPQRNARIIGGIEAPYGAFPWQVEIQMFNHDKLGFEHHGGGAVVAEHLVLTAAHCIQVPSIQYLRLVTGNYDLIERDLYEHSFRVDSVLPHPNFRQNGPYSNDIALIKVRASSLSGINFNTHVKPICLPTNNEEIPTVGTWCSVTGWGAQRAEDLRSIASVLRVAAVPLLDLETCRRKDVNGGRQQKILDTMLCAGVLKGGVDACGGDSGGPLACEHNGRFVLAGIVSWGDGCAKKNRPGVYTRVNAYIDWINEAIDELKKQSNN